MQSKFQNRTNDNHRQLDHYTQQLARHSTERDQARLLDPASEERSSLGPDLRKELSSLSPQQIQSLTNILHQAKQELAKGQSLQESIHYVLRNSPDITDTAVHALAIQQIPKHLEQITKSRRAKENQTNPETIIKQDLLSTLRKHDAAEIKRQTLDSEDLNFIADDFTSAELNKLEKKQESKKFSKKAVAGKKVARQNIVDANNNDKDDNDSEHKEQDNSKNSLLGSKVFHKQAFANFVEKLKNISSETSEINTKRRENRTLAKWLIAPLVPLAALILHLIPETKNKQQKQDLERVRGKIESSLARELEKNYQNKTLTTLNSSHSLKTLCELENRAAISAAEAKEKLNQELNLIEVNLNELATKLTQNSLGEFHRLIVKHAIYKDYSNKIEEKLNAHSRATLDLNINSGININDDDERKRIFFLAAQKAFELSLAELDLELQEKFTELQAKSSKKKGKNKFFENIKKLFSNAYAFLKSLGSSIKNQFNSLLNDRTKENLSACKNIITERIQTTGDGIRNKLEKDSGNMKQWLDKNAGEISKIVNSELDKFSFNG